MKKFFAILLTLVLVMSMSVPAFAAKSPEGKPVFQVHFIDGADDDKGVTQRVEKDKQGNDATAVVFTFKADEKKGKFDGWVIYKANGQVAVEGVDYRVLGAFSLTDEKIEIIPLASIVVTANYNGIKTETVILNEEDEAPQTGDNTVVYLSVIALAALCGIVVAKKQLAK
jgi:hypothetical protein